MQSDLFENSHAVDSKNFLKPCHADLLLRLQGDFTSLRRWIHFSKR